MATIPAAWLPKVAMQRVIVHWTAGANRASATDRRHYHIIVNGDGSLVRGNFSIADNVRVVKGRYAAHTRGTNPGSIGVALAGMHGAVERPFNPGRSPINKVQWDAMVRVVAQLCRVYGIAVSARTTLTHAEVQGTLGRPQSGKWDIAILPFDRTFNTAKKVGDRMRAEIARAA